MKVYNFTLPLHVLLPRKTKRDKKCILNLNYFTNWNPFVKKQIKEQFKLIFQEKYNYKDIKFKGPLKIEYRLHQGSNRKVDRMNPLSVIDKFFCDALVESGCMQDDSDAYIISHHFYSGEIDRENPRVEIKIYEL